MTNRIYLFDTTLRDGQQTTGVNFSVNDKMIIANSLNDLGIDLELLIQRVKTEALDSKNGRDRLNALKMLWDAFGVGGQKKVTEVAGIFQGFEPAQLKEVERPSLPEYQSTGDETI